MSSLGSFIWSIADQLRGPYRPNQYGTVILPFTILRRLDCILEPDRDTVRDLAAKHENPNRLRVEVAKVTGRPFYNTSPYSFANLLTDADGLADNLTDRSTYERQPDGLPAESAPCWHHKQHQMMRSQEGECELPSPSTTRC